MSFTTIPLSKDMVTQDSAKPNCLDLLCVTCGWEGRCEPKDAPWPIFRAHKCKMRIERIGRDF